MQQSNILEGLINELQKIAPEVHQLMPDEVIRNHVDLDSIDYLRFIEKINELFQVEIPEKDYPKLETLQDFEQYILKASRH